MKEETEYDVKIETKITGSIPMQTTYEDDPTLEQGKEKVVQKGHNGTYSEAYKVVYLNGKVVSRTLLSKDKYNQMSTIIKEELKEPLYKHHLQQRRNNQHSQRHLLNQLFLVNQRRQQHRKHLQNLQHQKSKKAHQQLRFK